MNVAFSQDEADGIMNEIDGIWRSIRHEKQHNYEGGPCFCPSTIHGRMPHTLKEHAMESCHGTDPSTVCGGCYTCLEMQWNFYHRKDK